jgi:hypothetical protein
MQTDIEHYLEEFKSLDDTQLLQEVHQSGERSGRHIAAKLLLERRARDIEGEREEKEEARHLAALRAANAANQIAKWAIVIAIVALVVAIVQTFWH